MTDPCDYPAAHSMDTMWFAVDRDGNVAVFESGEAGAVPTDGYLGEDWGEVLDAFRAYGHGSDVIRDLGAQIGSHARRDFADDRTKFILVLALDKLEAEPIGAQIRRVDSSGVPEGSAAFLCEGLSRELHDRLHERSVCLGCAWNFDAFDEEDPDPASFGLFCYEHTTDNWISGPYRRTRLPSRPVQADRLPRSVVKRCVEVDASFSDLLELNPPEHWPCEAWGPAWIESDGKTVHAFPGREDEMAEELADHPDLVLAADAHPADDEDDPEEEDADDKTLIGAPRKPWWKLW